MNADFYLRKSAMRSIRVNQRSLFGEPLLVKLICQ